MCKHMYKKYSNRTLTEMFYCRLRDGENNELKNLCSRQRYCNQSKSYVVNNVDKCPWKED